MVVCLYQHTILIHVRVPNVADDEGSETSAEDVDLLTVVLVEGSSSSLSLSASSTSTTGPLINI